MFDEIVRAFLVSTIGIRKTLCCVCQMFDENEIVPFYDRNNISSFAS
jgi:hypothetical protein